MAQQISFNLNDGAINFTVDDSPVEFRLNAEVESTLDNIRLLEDGDYRTLEDGSYRLLE